MIRKVLLLVALVASLLVVAPPLVQATTATLTWTDNANNEDTTIIERKTGAGGTWVQIGTVGANVTTYVDSTLPTPIPAGTLYFYRVKARNAAGDSPYSNDGGYPRPLGPTNLLAD